MSERSLIVANHMDAREQPKKILCPTCARYELEQYWIAKRLEEGRRCVAGVRFAGERTECPYYMREPSSDDGEVGDDGA